MGPPQFLVRMDNSRLPKHVIPGQLAEGAKKGRESRRNGWQACLDGNLAFSGSPGTGPQPPGMQLHGMIYLVGAKAKTAMARPKQAKEEEEATVPTAIDDAEEEVVPRLHSLLYSWFFEPLLLGLRGVERGERDAAGGRAGGTGRGDGPGRVKQTLSGVG